MIANFKLMILSILLLGMQAIPVIAEEAQEPVPVEKNKTALDFSETSNIKIDDISISLTNLNSYINKWFLLSIKGKGVELNLHLENRIIKNIISLTAKGVKISSLKNLAQVRECPLWLKYGPDLAKLDFESHPHSFYNLCDGLVFVRLHKPSNTPLSMTEITTNWLRKTSIGEGIINFFKPVLVELDAESDLGIKEIASAPILRLKDAPLEVKVRNLGGYNMVSTEHQLGIELENKKPINFGHWNKAKMHSGVYVSLFKPDLIEESILENNKSLAREIEPEEKDKLVYVIAYDLNQYTVNYAVGTKHPAINTSPELIGKQAEYNESIVPIGSIPPYEIKDAIGVFIGGFKSLHGRFKHGPLKGKTYGYIQNGVELEPMSSGLATVYLDLEGKIQIAKWPESQSEQQELRQKVVAARQNGAMIIEDNIPGSFVRSWKNGNWSGDANGLGRSLRSGICIQRDEKRQYLLFMSFYSATPSTMARTMQAYSCQQGMHLDMNAHMYLHNALYTFDKGEGFTVEYLNQEMLYPKTLKKHRFIMDNNQRDFFYIKRLIMDPSLVVTN